MMQYSFSDSAKNASDLIQKFLNIYPFEKLQDVFLLCVIKSKNGLLIPTQTILFEDCSSLDSHINYVIERYMYVCTENDRIDIGVSTENEAMRFSYDLKTRNITIPLYSDRSYIAPLNEIEMKVLEGVRPRLDELVEYYFGWINKG